MIDLKTCLRPDFIKAYQSLESENKRLSERLLEYEGIQTDDEKEKEFQKFWHLYGCKGNVKTARSKFFKLSRKKKTKIFKVVKNYVKSTPDKIYRKGGESWLHNECWNDEITGGEVKEFIRPSTGAKTMYVPPKPTSSTVDVSDRIKQMK